MFKKQPKPAGRTRPDLGRSQREPVFSYHASRSARATKTARGEEPAAALKRQSNGVWRKRLYSFGTLAVILLILASCLRLNTNPKVETVSAGADYIFLRDMDVYHQAAAEAFQSSPFNGNKLTISTTNIANNLKLKFPELAAVTVTLPVAGSQPVVYIQPAQPKMILSAKDSGLYLLDASGRALMNGTQVPDLKKVSAPVVTDESGISLKEGQLALPRATVTFISEVAGQLKAKKIKVDGYTLPPGANELHVRVSGASYYVKFNTHGVAREEVGTFIAAKEKLYIEKKTPKEYLDVRVENRVYFK